ncbi:MAG: bifunctional alpha,alpha-trehalose-phosphate synthase (UDP-forming)/trehalose-phosphatase, partial [Planctomycetes bacterium]|nr:bifunctional alpha,alpha-trehalose-phosphate synthase (UDP-forming)/trehalose-phosphatase [Planctomycetota bacterium]
IWVGWPGCCPEPGKAAGRVVQALAELRAIPVFVPDPLMDRFYNGFCNGTIWPLFHYFSENARYEGDCWESYVRVNETFRDAVLATARPGDVLWIHDYHLMLLPRMLREALPDAQIGFFLHIPFPSYELFRLLPRAWSTAILEGLCGADLIGFHTNDYAQYFLRCVLRLLGHDHYLGRILTRERVLRAGTYPMGIDFRRFFETQGPLSSDRAPAMGSGLPAKTLLSVDRLDYTKGIPQRLRAFELFLESQPQWRGRVTLVLIVVPSRIGVLPYRDVKREVEELVGKINGRYATLEWTPVRYMSRFFQHRELAALYRSSDAALVTPLRDGMNLVAKEWVASRGEGGAGALVLSETAGASKELVEAILVNPNQVDELAGAIDAALELPEEEQRRRISSMQARLARNDVVCWARTFLEDLRRAAIERERLRARMLGSRSRGGMVRAWERAARRLFLLDCDGTLIELRLSPSEASPSDALLSLLSDLASDEKNRIVVISGRERSTLSRWFAGLPLGLVAEHGVWVKEGSSDWKTLGRVTTAWKPRILSMLESHVDRLPGSFVEEKEYSLAWHFRACDPEFAASKAQEVADELIQLTANIDVNVLLGNRVLEVRCAGANKGNAAHHFLEEEEHDFVLAIGDDSTDEEMFRVLPESAYTIRVGLAHSHARFNVRDPGEVQDLLRGFAVPGEPELRGRVR